MNLNSDARERDEDRGKKEGVPVVDLGICAAIHLDSEASLGNVSN